LIKKSRLPIVIVGTALLVSAARAQAPAPDALAAAKVHFEQGVTLYNDGNFAGALAEFSEAYRLYQAPGVLYNIGLTQKSLFRYAEAVGSLEQYLKESPTLEPDRKREVEQLIGEMRALLGDVAVKVTPPAAPRPVQVPQATVLAAGQTRTSKPHAYWYIWTPIVIVAAGIAIGVGVGLTSKPSTVAGTLAPGVQPVN
jgi:tetratricopeptide (TPR) repeat protein